MPSNQTRFLFRRVAISFLLLGMGLTIAYAQSSKTPEARVKNFYSWYLKGINDGQDPSKNKAVMNSHLSARLGKWYSSKAGRELDSDYFVRTQEWSDEWAGHVNVGEPSINGTTAVVDITFGSTSDEWHHKLQIGLIMEGGMWKIDRVTDGVTVAQTVAKRPALPSNLESFVGEYPAKLMKIPSVSGRLKTLLGKSYADFADSISVQHEVTKDGDFLLASGCMQHMCDSNGAAFVIDLKNRRIHAAIYDEEADPQFFNEDKVPPPRILLDWMAEKAT